MTVNWISPRATFCASFILDFLAHLNALNIARDLSQTTQSASFGRQIFRADLPFVRLVRAGLVIGRALMSTSGS